MGETGQRPDPLGVQVGRVAPLRGRHRVGAGRADDADLSGLDLVAIMVDGVHFAQHLCVVALGIGIDGTKHPLALVEGDTENATVVKRLLVGLRERGLDVTKPTLFVLDGAKALSAGGQRGLRPPGHRPL
jgi:hypothetical protein